MLYQEEKFFTPQKDPLGFIVKISYDAFKNKWYQGLVISAFMYHTCTSTITVCYFIVNPRADVILRYIASLMAVYSLLFFASCRLLGESAIKSLLDRLASNAWSMDKTSRQCEEKIQKESFYLTIFVCFNNLCAIGTALMMWTTDEEDDYHLYTYYIKTNFPRWLTFSKIFYVGSYVFLGLAVSSVVHLAAYVAYHLKFQFYLMEEYIVHVTDDYQNENSLFENANYQNEVQIVLSKLIKRYILMRHFFELIDSIAGKLIPFAVLAGLAMGLSIMCHLYMNFLFGKWLYVQMAFWGLSGVVDMIIFTHCGQIGEDTFSEFPNHLYNMQWLPFNQSNRKTFLNILTASQDAMQFKFVNITVNYNLGVWIVKMVYSFAATILRFRTYQANQI